MISLEEFNQILSRLDNLTERLIRLENYIQSSNLKDRENFTDVKGAKIITGFEISTIYKFVEKNQIPFKKIGGKLLFDKLELEIWRLSKTQNRERGKE